MGGPFGAQATPQKFALASILAGATSRLTLQPPDGFVYVLDRFTWSGRMQPNVFSLACAGNGDLATFAAALITEDWFDLGLPDFRNQTIVVVREFPLVFDLTNEDVVARDLEYTVWYKVVHERMLSRVRALGEGGL